MGDVELGMVERGWPSVGGDTTPDDQQPNRIYQRWIPRCWSLDVTCDYNQHREIGENREEIKNYTFIIQMVTVHWERCL